MKKSDYIKKLKLKRKTKVNKILEYFNEYYPNLKLRCQIGNTVKVKYRGRLLESFNSSRLMGSRRMSVNRYDGTHTFALLKRFKIPYNRDSYQLVVVPNYYFVIRNIERQLINMGILVLTLKLKRKVIND